MDPFTLVIGGLLGLFAGGAIFALLWNRYRDKIREWNIANNTNGSLLSEAVVKLDRWVTNIYAKVRVKRKDRYYDEVVFEETLTEEQVNTLKSERPELFKMLEDGQAVDVDILSNI